MASMLRLQVPPRQGTICSIHHISDRNAVGAGRPLTGFPAYFPIIDWGASGFRSATNQLSPSGRQVGNNTLYSSVSGWNRMKLGSVASLGERILRTPNNRLRLDNGA